ncbi:CLUMA_CG017654, isoform A [Clunio marinus]|uniref:CLUMA_CG017654, isoform A n=1 Tax=Clunio marinus TaxID=568069 RepID=A0A1J1J154_9DIPT|nr:CLUMA_CG017654, isoform A [Clunio marinus]
MNLMFRKNFREGGSSASKSSATKLTKTNRTGKRSRDMSYSGPSTDESFTQYRTHLFFNANRSGYQDDNGELRCSAISSPISPSIEHTNIIPASNVIEHGDFLDAYSTSYQPLIQRNSMGNIKWDCGNNDRSTSEAQTPQVVTGTKVSFSGQKNGTATGAFVSSRSEPISLSTLDRDCFIIPVRSLERFMPAGISLPAAAPETKDPTYKASSLSVLEVSDPKICILAHLMSPLEPLDPLLESPLSHPLLKQRAVASELLHEIQQGNNASGGMLLANMERHAEFPFIAYYTINTTQTDPSTFYSNVRGASLTKFEPKNTRYTAAHTLDIYSEVASICRPPLLLAPSEQANLKKTPTTAYIISVYKVFEGDDGERFERNWLYWTGARMLYRYLPRNAGLRKITLHKSVAKTGDKMYLLICECSELLKDLSAAAYLVPAMRARLCGYTAIYRPIQTF